MERIPGRSDKTAALSERPPRALASWQTDDALWISRANFVGAKAVGLYKLPRSWTPTFLVLTAAFYDLAGQLLSVAQALDSLVPNEMVLLDKFLDEAKREPSGQTILPYYATKQVMVRSNAPEETLRDRGAYTSYAVQPNRDAVTTAIERIFAQANGTMCIVLQLAIDRGMLGHMSNERRITPNPKRWLVEYGSEAVPFQKYLHAKKSEEYDATLPAKTQDEVLNILRSVASVLTSIGTGYHHCEWVWDGERVWIVQCDDAAPLLASDASGAREFLLKDSPTNAIQFEPDPPLYHYHQTEAVWSKLERPKIFKQFGLPTHDVCFISGMDWTSEERRKRAILVEGLEKMCVDPVVIRCDVTKAKATAELLLPTSKASTNIDDLLLFMDEATVHFHHIGLRPNEWAFLPSRLVPARACAMVHAFPGGQYARVDSLWGFPDGLLHYAHDTYFYYFSDNKTSSHVRYKGQCVVPEGTGWVTLPLFSPLDWMQVLDKEEISTLAEWGLRLADGLGKQIQLMALARINGIRGSRGCLPWHYTDFEVPQYTDSLRAPTWRTSAQAVRDRDDLSRAKARRDDSSIHAYQIQPTAALLRDEQFLIEVAMFAAERRKLLYFEGSVLAHAYYIMSRAGASVVPVADEPKQSRKIYRKLVRDLIPVVIREAGGLARVRTVPRSHANEILKQKLIEEAFEVRAASGNNLTEEIADMLDVIEALQNHAEIANGALQSVRQKKQARRGGFDHLIYLEETDIRPLRIDRDDLAVKSLSFRASNYLEAELVRIESDWNSKEGLRFNISLVPPASAGEETIIRDVGSNIRLVVTYRGATVNVGLGQKNEASTPDQLVFPFLDEATVLPTSRRRRTR